MATEEGNGLNTDELVLQFELQRPRLLALAYRTLGSLTEAEDTVQEAWVRLARSDSDVIENLSGWLTTVTARICLDLLRLRVARDEQPLAHLPDPIVSPADGSDPEHEALLADSLGLALLVVLQTLSPAERLAFILHDMFAVPFDQISLIIERSPAATKMLASRARRRIRTAPVLDPDLGRQREVVDAFLAAARDGDFEALLAVLDPGVVLRTDGGAQRSELSTVIRGAATVASRAIMFAGLADTAEPVLVNGASGIIAATGSQVMSLMAFTVSNGGIVEINALIDPERLSDLR